MSATMTAANETTHKPVEVDWRYIYGQPIRRGDLVVYATWNFAEDPPTQMLLLVAASAARPGDELRVVGISLAEAWKWSRTHNSDRQMIGYHGFGKPPTSDAWQEAHAAAIADRLGLDGDDRRTRNHVRATIEDLIPDLVNVPPAPRREGRPRATFELIDQSSGETTEHTIEDI